jgi:hypothetical protein
MSKICLIWSKLYLNNIWICLKRSKLYLFCNRLAVRNRKYPGCESLAKRPARPWRLISRQGIPDVGCILVSGLHVHLIAVLRWVRPTTPGEPAFLWLNPFAYSVYDCIWACQASTSPWHSTIRTLQPVPGTLAQRVFAWMEPADTAQLPVEGAKCFKKLATHCQEGTLRGRRIWEQHPAYSGPRRWAKGPPSTCLESQIGPPGWGCTKKLNAAGGLGMLCWVRRHLFLECHELPVKPRSPWDDLLTWGKFRHF